LRNDQFAGEPQTLDNGQKVSPAAPYFSHESNHAKASWLKQIRHRETQNAQSLRRHPIGRLRFKAQILEVEFSNRSIVQYERVFAGCIGASVAAALPTGYSRDQIEESYKRVARARSFLRQVRDERERE
jgi:hypothetical protein